MTSYIWSLVYAVTSRPWKKTVVLLKVIKDYGYEYKVFSMIIYENVTNNILLT